LCIFAELANSLQLFYEANTFDFTEEVEAVTYLVAITEHRRNAIRSVISSLELYCSSLAWPKFIAMLGSCAGLQKLVLQVPYRYQRYHESLHSSNVLESLSNSSSFKQILGMMQGLMEYTLEFDAPASESDRSDFEKLCEWVRSKFDESKKLPRVNNYSRKIFDRAHLEAHLDVHGGGRLGEDKRPGIVASRTRLQTRNVERLDDDGILPDREVPKYDLDGNLTWHVKLVKDVRSASSEDSTSGIEFEVCQPPFPGR